MGSEINSTRFRAADFDRFQARLEAETTALAGRLQLHAHAETPLAGFELEAWLLDHNYYPHPINQAFLQRLASPLVVPELARFNIELNGTPQALQGDALRRLQAELETTWQHCQAVAHELQSTLILIGILPTLRNADLCMANISPLKRYRALNAQVLKARGGRPIQIDIAGRQRLRINHDDVMLEAAATSFQLHLQAPQAGFTRHFNASLVLSAPMVAAAANSPYLFETELWEETRIPLFEQAVDTGSLEHPERRRVTFGSGYLERPDDAFRENAARYPVLLPITCDDDPCAFSHLRLHNGTIWRWNRPLVGHAADGTPRLRIEHRVLPAGPSITDMVANAALYLGATHFLATCPQPPEADLAFAHARDNFYRAARDGLAARLRWLDGREHEARALLLEALLPMAAHGLERLGVDAADCEHYLGIVRARVANGQNGAAWQRGWIAAHGRDFFGMTAAYLHHQRSGMPVHEWEL